jgi:RNA polymerase sigma factor (sigma-70 family)
VMGHLRAIRTAPPIPDRRWQKMHDADFERLYEREAKGLYAFLAYRTGDRGLAEDLLADTFERALRARRGFDRRRGTERNWLYAIALNLLRDHARRAATEGRAVERVATSAPAAADSGEEAVERRDELQRAMAGLAEEEREAIALRFGAELTVPEMAAVLGLPLSTVEGRVYRALRKLRERL